MPTPLTVGVPVYNAERFLERCLNNLCAEDLDYRIIIADNASTDGTQDIAQSFARMDGRIRYLRHETNMGAEKNFLFLLKMADSEVFAWRAYDDVSSPGYFKNLSSAIVNHQNINLAVGNLDFLSEKGDHPPKKMVPDILPSGEKARRKMLLDIAAPAWIYGVFRHSAIAKRYLDIRSAFHYTWAMDTLILLPFLLEASVFTDSTVTFSEYLCNQSADRYRPKGVLPAVRLVSQFCRYGFTVADELAVSPLHKAQLYSSVVRYANGRAEKFRRIAKRAMFWPLYKVTGRL